MMPGKIIGYIRVIIYEQSGDRQLDGLTTDLTYSEWRAHAAVFMHQKNILKCNFLRENIIYYD